MAEVVLMNNGITPFYPGVNCIHCGRFIGRDGALYFEYFEMSSELASLDGECARCLENQRLGRDRRSTQGAQPTQVPSKQAVSGREAGTGASDG